MIGPGRGFRNQRSGEPPRLLSEGARDYDEERALDVYDHPFAYAAQRRQDNETSAMSLAVDGADGWRLGPCGSPVRLLPGRVSKFGAMLRRIDKVNEEG
jgi:hypothetical protein